MVSERPLHMFVVWLTSFLNVFFFRYVTGEGKSDFTIKLINDILVELLLKDYLLSAKEKKQYEILPAVPDVSNDNSSELSYEKSTQRINSNFQASYVQELVRCIVVILLDISVEDTNLLSVFSASFLKECLKLIQQGDSLQNFHEYVERIVRFFLLLDQLVLQKGYDWPLHLFGRPLFVTTLPVIKTMVNLTRRYVVIAYSFFFPCYTF